MPFEITYFVPDGQTPEAPESGREINVSRRRSGGLQAAQQIEFATDYAQVSPAAGGLERALAVQRCAVRAWTGSSSPTSSRSLTPATVPEVDTLPVDITAPVNQRFVRSTLAPSRLERRGRVASFDNITPGALGYVFHNYVRVFNEVKSVTTGTEPVLGLDAQLVFHRYRSRPHHAALRVNGGLRVGAARVSRKELHLLRPAF